MLRYWLDDVGDGLLYGTFVTTAVTAAVSFLLHVPEGLGRPSLPTEEVVEEVREITVGMLPDPVQLLGDVAAEQPAAEPVAAEPERAPAPELIGARDDAPAPPPERVAKVEEERLADALASEQKKPAAKGKRCDDPPDPGIVKRADASFTIDRAVVKRYTSDWSRLNELGWSERHEGADGKADGMRIGGVRCGSDLHDAGIRAGDVVHTVNGRKVTSIPQAILVYTAVRNDPVIEVVLSTRKGERKTLTYRFTG